MLETGSLVCCWWARAPVNCWYKCRTNPRPVKCAAGWPWQPKHAGDRAHASGRRSSKARNLDQALEQMASGATARGSVWVGQLKKTAQRRARAETAAGWAMASLFCCYRLKCCINIVTVEGSAWNGIILLQLMMGGILLHGGPFLSSLYTTSEHDPVWIPSGRKK